MLDTREDETEMLSLMRRFIALCRRKPVIPAEGAMFHEILKEIRQMSDTFNNELAQLQADVAAQSTVIASATTAFQGLAAQIAAAETAARNAGATDVQVAGVASVRQALEANTAALAAAVPANTSAAAATPTPATGLTAPVANTGTAPTGVPPAGSI
jgi:septal ring factor EnvC (AmiA/AmiB activator)